MSSAAFIASESASGGMGNTTVTVNKPTGTLEGHTMIAVIACEATGASTAADAQPGGWTVIGGMGAGKRMWYKVADNTDETVTTDYTWDYTTLIGGFVGGQPLFGAILTYSDFGTRGLNNGMGSIFGGGSVGIPGFSQISYCFAQYGVSGHSPSLVQYTRFPNIGAAIDRQGSSLTPPTNTCNHATLRETVGDSGFWAGIGANAAWSMTVWDILDEQVQNQPEMIPMFAVGSNSSTSSGSTALGAFRNQDSGTDSELEPAPDPIPGSARIELPATRMRLQTLPNRLNDASLRELQ